MQLSPSSDTNNKDDSNGNFFTSSKTGSPLFDVGDYENDDDHLLDDHEFFRAAASPSPPSLKTPLKLHHQIASEFKTPSDPSSQKSAATSRRPPAYPSKQHKRKSKKRVHSDEDDSRPDSDKRVLQPLQLAKQNAQKKKRDEQRKQDMVTRASKNSGANSENFARGNNNDGLEGETSGRGSNSREQVDKNQGDRQGTGAGSPSLVSTASGDSGEAPTAKKSSGSAKESSASAKESAALVAPSPAGTTYKAWAKYAKRTTEDIDQDVAIQRTKDAKLNKTDRMKALTKSRRMVLELQLARAKDQVYIHSKEMEVKELQDAALVRISRSKAQKLRLCKDTITKVEEVTKTLLWRSTKYFTCPEDLETGAEKVIEMGKFCEGMNKEQVGSFLVTYSPIIKKALNSARNYLTAELKKVAFNCFLEEGLELPHVDVFLACAMRQVPTMNEEKFKFYWTHVLRKCNDSKLWCKEIFYYHTPSQARMDMSDPNSLRLFTVSHEAMILTIWENNWDKWQKQYQHVLKNPGAKHPTIQGKWTTSDSGQAEWGGWSKDGLMAYNNYKKKIRDGRKGRKEDIAAFEARILLELRQSVGIEADTHEAQLRMNRAKKRKLNSKKPVGAIACYKAVATVDEDDEDEEME